MDDKQDVLQDGVDNDVKLKKDPFNTVNDLEEDLEEDIEKMVCISVVNMEAVLTAVGFKKEYHGKC